MDKGMKILIILTILLFGMNVYQNNRLTDLENQLNNQMHNLSNYQITISNLDHSIRSTLANWEMENKWVREGNFKLINISKDLEEMTVSFNWSFNSLEKDEKVYLMLGQKNDSADVKWEMYPVESKNDLSYYKEITIPFKEDYVVEIIGDSNGNKRSAKLQDIYFYRQIIDRVQIHGSFHQSKEGAILSLNLFNPSIVLKFFGSEEIDAFDTKDLFLTKAVVEVYKNQSLVDTVDLLVDGHRFDQGGGKFEMEEMEEIIDFSRIYKDIDLNKDRVKVIFKGEDNLGIVYEKEVQLK